MPDSRGSWGNSVHSLRGYRSWRFTWCKYRIRWHSHHLHLIRLVSGQCSPWLGSSLPNYWFWINSTFRSHCYAIYDSSFHRFRRTRAIRYVHKMRSIWLRRMLRRPRRAASKQNNENWHICIWMPLLLSASQPCFIFRHVEWLVNNRRSLILFLFMELTTFRSLDSSRKGNAHIEWKIQEWQMKHGVSSSAVGNPFLLNVRQWNR